MVVENILHGDCANGESVELKHVVEKDTLAAVARRLFVRASVTYPALVVAQGTMIARLCNEMALSPGSLMHALLEDKKSTATLASVANKVHSSRGVRLRVVKNSDIRRVIMLDFECAKRFSRLPSHALEDIEAKYDNVKNKKWDVWQYRDYADEVYGRNVWQKA